VEAGGQVEQGAGDGGHGDPLDAGAMMSWQEARAVQHRLEPRVVTRSPTTMPAHLDHGRRESRQTPEASGSHSGDDSAVTQWSTATMQR
jgi:hypothetical protein